MAIRDELITDIRDLIEESRSRVSVEVNAALTMLNWHIGKRIDRDILKGDRAEYGREIVSTLSRELQIDYGKGFSKKNIWRIIQFSRVFPDKEIVVTLSRELSWSHFLALIPLKKPFQRQFYAEMCRLEGWSVRTLREKIDSMLYERTAISKKPQELAEKELSNLREKDRLAPDLVLKDPYVLDFLELSDHYLEKDLEDSILRELEEYLLELGAGFTFICRQKRIQIDNDDFYIDLLFYNRKLNRLIAMDLKLGKFKAEYKGQMELYLRWLAKNEQGDNEKTPLGIILCAGKKHEQIELLELDSSGIHVAEYLTVLPPKKVLENRLHRAIEKARSRSED
ncbi:DUF1016 family protein [Candidatus Peregrinibacteria bacterium]|nr:DUF1016 family protein [Candidatus Peregrinibacteria bacterium]